MPQHCKCTSSLHGTLLRAKTPATDPPYLFYCGKN